MSRTDGQAIDFRGHGIALGIGGLGGAAFFLLGMPLAWMMGSLVAVSIAAMAGVNPFMSRTFRAVMVCILGVFLGSAFTPDVLDRAPQWAMAFLVLMGFIVVGGTLAYQYLRRVGRFDPVTAYFSAAPGGLTEMVLSADEMGGDMRRVSLIHTIRVMTIIIVIPFWFRLVIGADVPSMMPAPDGPVPQWIDWTILIGCAVLGWPLARTCRIPAASLVGPMILSAIAHLSGLTHAQPPPEPVAAAQVVLGAAVGCRFAGTSLRMIGGVAVHALITALMLIGIAVLFMMIFASVIGVAPSAMILVLSPGGLAEMSLIALALGIDTAFVSTMQLCRIIVIILVAPSVFRLALRLFGATKN